MFVHRWLLGNINKTIYAAASAQDEVTHEGEEVLPLKIKTLKSKQAANITARQKKHDIDCLFICQAHLDLYKF